MSYEHAKNDPIAEAEIVVSHAEEEDDARDPRLVELYLDTDEMYSKGNSSWVQRLMSRSKGYLIKYPAVPPLGFPYQVTSRGVT